MAVLVHRYLVTDQESDVFLENRRDVDFTKDVCLVIDLANGTVSTDGKIWTQIKVEE